MGEAFFSSRTANKSVWNKIIKVYVDKTCDRITICKRHLPLQMKLVFARDDDRLYNPLISTENSISL